MTLEQANRELEAWKSDPRFVYGKVLPPHASQVPHRYEHTVEVKLLDRPHTKKMADPEKTK